MYSNGAKRTQSDKFKDLAREVEADEDEAAFDARLRSLVRPRAANVRTYDIELGEDNAWRRVDSR